MGDLSKMGDLSEEEILNSNKEYIEKVCPDETEREELISILELASQRIFQKFKLPFETAETLGCVWVATFEAFRKYFKKVSEKYDNAKIVVANRFVIGFDTSNDENDEKQGNFGLYMTQLKTDFIDDVDFEFTDNPLERAVKWNVVNRAENTNKTTDEISIEALNIMKKKFLIHLASHEFVIPTFVIVYESLIKFISIKRKELDEFEYTINFLSEIEVTCRETEDGEIIDIIPSVSSKVDLKSDVQASSKFDV